MNHPIQNDIGAVFVPVSDMERAIAWYSALLGLPAARTTHGGKIYDLPMQGPTQLILDGHRPVANSSQPLVFFWTTDIAGAYRFFQEQGIPIEGQIEDIGSVSTLQFRDPDGNRLMVCQRNP